MTIISSTLSSMNIISVNILVRHYLSTMTAASEFSMYVSSMSNHLRRWARCDMEPWYTGSQQRRTNTKQHTTPQHNRR